ncbi:MAG: S8 family serine peptidase [Anaeromyxobacter sp.]|nr:S8 family serine peptidase [Anaeromyxobacter sp.]
MSRRLPASLALAVLALAAACGGGGSDPTPPPPTEFDLSGTIRAAGGQRVDGDTGDVNSPKTPNDGPATAQLVPSAVTVGGWASFSADALDAYRATLAAGQVVTLGIADAVTGDLDLCLYAAADVVNPVACSLGVGSTEVVEVPAGGDHYVVVEAASGASNYVLTIGAAPAAASLPALRSDREFVPGEVVVRFNDAALSPAAAGDSLQARAAALGLAPLAGAVRGRPALLGLGATAATRAAALATLGAPARTGAAFGGTPEGPAAARLDTLRVVKALLRRADVQSADPNYLFRPSAVPNDTHYKFQWHYPLINLPQAWDVTTGTPATGSVVVAVLDTGVFLAHPDFTGQLVDGYDFIRDATKARDGGGIDANADDPGDAAAAGSSSWHGTHVAGTVAARSNEGAGAAGVAWGAKVMPVRVLGAGGGTSYDIIQGLRFAAGLSNDSGTLPPKAADVANLSLGCQGCSSQSDKDAYAAVRAAGLIVVAAAGNENSTSPGYPASYPGVVSVSAVDLAQARAPYSNRGPDVDVAAPGGDTSADKDGNGYADGVLSALVDDSTGTRQPIWTFYQGTSMAAPHVAGVVALMKAVCPSLTPLQLDTLLASGAMTRDLGAAGRDDVYGHGLVDALGAVQAAQSQCGAAQTGGLEVTPTRLDFAPGVGSLPIAVAWSGTGLKAVTGVASDATWLTVAPGAVDGNNHGAYTATAAQASLADGRYSATITFTLAGGAAVRVPVSLQKGAAAAAGGDAGFLYVLLVDPVPNAQGNLATVAQASGRGQGGVYTWSFANVPAGQYLLVAGTDSDNDDLVCDDGEACGAWPTLGVPTPVTVAAADVAGLDFLAGFESSLGAASAGPATGRAGYRKLAPLKGLEVTP